MHGCIIYIFIIGYNNLLFALNNSFVLKNILEVVNYQIILEIVTSNVLI
jgi:hypothetical protein